MKKSLVALAALAVVGAASAQSSVTLYGVVDVNVTNSKQGGQTLTSLNNGGLNGSRWGLRGTEDLGGGLSGIFQLESGFNPDNGTSAQGGRLFGRTAIVGLAGGFGRVTLGRTYSPIGLLADESATMNTAPLSMLTAAGMLSGGTFYRTDNALTYFSPNFAGLTFAGQYSLARDGAETSGRVGRHAGFNVLYKGGPLSAGVGYLTTRPAGATLAPVAPAVVGTSIAEQRAVMANIGYNFGVATVRGVFERDRNPAGAATTPAEDPTFFGLEASFPLGAFTASAGVARLRDATGAAGVSDDANLYSLNGVYNLSKRTALYTIYTNVENKGNAVTGAQAGFTTASGVANVAAARGGKARAFQVGVRHSF